MHIVLSQPILYSPGTGDQVEGSFIDVTAPTAKIAHLMGILKCEIGGATKKSLEGIDIASLQALQDDSDDQDEDPEVKGEGIYQGLVMGGADMTKVSVTFKEILKVSGQLAGERDLNMILIDKMSYNDFEKCLKAYLGHFM